MKKIISPHDHFFRNAMSDIRVAKDFFNCHLPADIKKIVNLDSLKLHKESYVDEKLKLAITDMLYSADFNDKPGYLCLLAEHQSRPDPMMPFRLLKYIVQIIEQHLKQLKTDKLPIVYPLVFYHGKVRYNCTKDIMDLFDDMALARKIMFKPFQLVDITQIPDEKIKQHVWSSVLELCMKHIFARDILPYLREIVDNLYNVERHGGADYIKSALTYLLFAGEVKNKQAFVETVKRGLSSEIGESIMTIAQQFKAEGRVEGRAEGKAEGRKEAQKIIASKLLQQNMALETISQLTELTLDEIQALAKASEH